MANKLLLKYVEFSVVHEDVDVAPGQGVIQLINVNSCFTVFDCGSVASIHHIIQPFKVRDGKSMFVVNSFIK